MQGDKELLSCLRRGFSWNRLKGVLFRDKTTNNEMNLEFQILQAKRAWLIALDQIDWADNDMLDAAILYATACEKRYIALLQKAKHQGYTSWDKTIAPVASNS